VFGASSQMTAVDETGAADADDAITPAESDLSERVPSLRWYDCGSSNSAVSADYRHARIHDKTLVSCARRPRPHRGYWLDSPPSIIRGLTSLATRATFAGFAFVRQSEAARRRDDRADGGRTSAADDGRSGLDD
jgi:hypothetical protein